MSASADQFHAFVECFHRRGEAGGVLAGRALAAKDCLDLAGRSPGCGLVSRSKAPSPRDDAQVITLLRGAGLDLIGMTQMTALAYEPSGHNAALGRPRNPHNAAFICGGSSSGSAVAVSAGMADYAIGTDTAGSVRIPAHCCGIAGWKPSNGLISADGVMPLAPSLDTIGFLAKTVSALADLTTVVGAAGNGGLSSLVVAADLAKDSPPSVQAAINAVIAACDGPPRHVDALALLKACDPPVLTLLQGEAYRAHAARLAAGGLDPTLDARLRKGESIGDQELAAATARLAELATEALDAVIGSDDVLLLPVLPGETPRVSMCEPTSPDFSPRTLYGLSALTRFANGLGLPVVTLPAGRDSNNMPVGVQLVARRSRDADLLTFAALIEARLAAGQPPERTVP